MIAELSTALVAGGALLAIRIGVALRLIPFFGGAPMPVLPWLGLTAALSLLLATTLGLHPATVPSGPAFAALATKELFVGLVIGASIRFAFSVFEMVGSIVHLSAFGVLSPGNRTAMTTAYTLLGAGVFLAVGGHHGVISGLAATVRAVPPVDLPGWESMVGAGHAAAVALFCTAMATAVLIAAPLFFAGLFADLTIGVLSRFYSGVGVTGAVTLRVIAVQLLALASLGLVVTHGISLLVSLQ